MISIFVLKNTNIFCIILFIIWTSSSALPYAFFINAIIDDLRISRSIIGILYSLFNFLVNIFAMSGGFNLNVLHIFSFLFPSCGVYIILYNLININDNGYFTLSKLIDNVDGYSTPIGFIGLVMWQIIWTFFSIYLDSVCGSEIKRSPLFCCKKKFCGWNK